MSVLTDDDKHDLDEVFYGSGLLIKQFPLFKEKTKGLGISDEKLKYYYDNQEVVQLFKPIVVPKKYVSITAKGPFDRLYFDSMYITPLNVSLVNAVDLFSKYGFVMLYRGSSIDSAKASKALETFVREIINMGYYPATVRTDPGPEFHGSFKTTCESLGLPLIYLDEHDKLQSSPIEGFNRTIRLALEKVRAILPSDNPVTSQVEKAIYDIVSAYNNTTHSATRLAPSAILKDEDIQLELTAKNALKEADQVKELRSQPLPAGQSVRVMQRQVLFNKLTPNWSKEIYKIDHYDEAKNRYYLEGKRKGYQLYQLHPINTKTLMKKTITKYIVKGAKVDDVKQVRSVLKAMRELKTDLLGQAVGARRERKERQIMDV